MTGRVLSSEHDDHGRQSCLISTAIARPPHPASPLLFIRRLSSRIFRSKAPGNSQPSRSRCTPALLGAQNKDGRHRRCNGQPRPVRK